jgi:hypothetical protein
VVSDRDWKIGPTSHHGRPGTVMPINQASLSCSSPKSAMSLRVPPRAATNLLSTSWVETSPLSIVESLLTAGRLNGALQVP